MCELPSLHKQTFCLMKYSDWQQEENSFYISNKPKFKGSLLECGLNRHLICFSCFSCFSIFIYLVFLIFIVYNSNLSLLLDLLILDLPYKRILELF